MRDGIPDLRRAALAVACVTAMCLAVLVLVAAPVQAQETAAEDQYVPGPDTDCPGAEVVDTIPGTGSKETAPFRITGERFRVTTAAASSEGATADDILIIINVTTADGKFVNSITKEGDAVESAIVNAGPGGFILDIGAANATYTIVVEDCTDTQGNPPANEQPDPADEDDTEDPGDTDVPGDVMDETIPDQPLPDTGGLPLVVLVVLGLALLGVGSSVVRAGIERRS